MTAFINENKGDFTDWMNARKEEFEAWRDAQKQTSLHGSNQSKIF